jgi:hypothetical protein
MYFLSKKIHRIPRYEAEGGAPRKLGGLAAAPACKFEEHVDRAATTGGRAQSLRSLFRR